MKKIKRYYLLSKKLFISKTLRNLKRENRRLEYKTKQLLKIN